MLCKTVFQQSSPKETDLTHGAHISGVFWWCALLCSFLSEFDKPFSCQLRQCGIKRIVLSFSGGEVEEIVCSFLCICFVLFILVENCVFLIAVM